MVRGLVGCPAESVLMVLWCVSGGAGTLWTGPTCGDPRVLGTSVKSSVKREYVSGRCVVGSRCGSLTLRCGRGARWCVSKE